MLERKIRLKKNNDFDAVWQKGRSSFDGLFGVKALKNGLEYNRFGILVGLKVGKKAVDRNRVKRLVRHVLAKSSPLLAKGFDIVIVSLPAVKDKDISQVEASILSGLKKLRIIT